MTNQEPGPERRKSRRFHVKSDAFVILRPSDTHVGRLIDISMDGLAFDYVIGTELPKPPTELDIFVKDGSFRLSNVPCQALWVKTTYESPLTSTNKKRCGVRFGELTKKQKAELERFIQKHTSAIFER